MRVNCSEDLAVIGKVLRRVRLWRWTERDADALLKCVRKKYFLNFNLT